jgi:hypothetical protein
MRSETPWHLARRECRARLRTSTCRSLRTNRRSTFFSTRSNEQAQSLTAPKPTDRLPVRACWSPAWAGRASMSLSRTIPGMRRCSAVASPCRRRRERPVGSSLSSILPWPSCSTHDRRMRRISSGCSPSRPVGSTIPICASGWRRWCRPKIVVFFCSRTSLADSQVSLTERGGAGATREVAGRIPVEGSWQCPRWAARLANRIPWPSPRSRARCLSSQRIAPRKKLALRSGHRRRCGTYSRHLLPPDMSGSPWRKSG